MIDNKKDHYFVAVYTSNPGGNSPDQIKESYDYRIAESFYRHNKNSAYKLLYEYIKQQSQLHSTSHIITVSEDKNIMEHTTTAYNRVNKNIKTIYLSNDPTIYINNVFYLGIDNEIGNEIESKLLDNMDSTNDTYFTLKKIKQLGFKTLIPLILEKFSDKQIHLVIDLGIFHHDFVPSVVRQHNDENHENNFLSFSDLQELVNQLQNKIMHLDIVGFDTSIDDTAFRFTKMTGNVCRYIIRDIFTLADKKINVFSEDSKFLIFRPVVQTHYDNKDKDKNNLDSNGNESDDDFEEYDENSRKVDIGWYVVRFMTLKDREIFIEKIKDNIITIEYEKDGKMVEVYVTTTTMKEQNEKSYYTANNIFDCCLFPQEKSLMVFELLNAQYNQPVANILKDK